MSDTEPTDGSAELAQNFSLPLGAAASENVLTAKHSHSVLVGSVLVRDGSIDDLQAVYDLFDKHLKWINSWFATEQVIQRFTTLERIKTLLSQSPSVIAQVGDQTVGFITTQVREPDVLSLTNFYVDDAYRNRGVGLQMLNLLDVAAASVGCTSIFGTSSVAYFPNKPTPRTLFARAGYDIIGLSSLSELYAKRNIETKIKNNFTIR